MLVALRMSGGCAKPYRLASAHPAKVWTTEDIIQRHGYQNRAQPRNRAIASVRNVTASTPPYHSFTRGGGRACHRPCSPRTLYLVPHGPCSPQTLFPTDLGPCSPQTLFPTDLVPHIPCPYCAEWGLCKPADDPILEVQGLVLALMHERSLGRRY